MGGGEQWRERERSGAGAAGVDAREDGCDRVFNSVVGFVSKITAGLFVLLYLSTAWGRINQIGRRVGAAPEGEGRGGARCFRVD
jgi:hypothetical protein